MWQLTVRSLADLRGLGLEGEQALLDAYHEAHIDLLVAVVELRR